MEAVPRLPMISFPARESPENTEFREVLKKYIRYHYNEDPESYNSEINELELLRIGAITAQMEFMGCSTLKKYYCQLQYLTSRFPLDDAGIKLSFTWKSAFDSGSVVNGDLSYEMNSILFNIAAFHTNLGTIDSRTSSDGMKISCTHFQCAAWAYQVLSQNPHSDGEINANLMIFMMNISLSQAQECILEKSLTDNRKPNIIAKVAMQVVEYLRLSLKNLDTFKKSSSNATEIVGHKVIKGWQSHCDFKIAYYLAATFFHQGLVSEEQQKMGERISYYQAAVEKLDEASKLAKSLDRAKPVGETLTFANDVIRGKLTAAQKENEFVYHEKVPPSSALAEVKGASLVKCIPFSYVDEDVAGPDIFGRLVPLEAHQASSLYSEEKAKLLRRISSQINEKNEELEMYLASMQIDSLILEENQDSFPQELVDACADFNSRSALRVLTEIMNDINNRYHNLQSKISETELCIKDEGAKEKEFSIVIGSKQAPNHLLTEQKRELCKYKEAHEAAISSNQALHEAITQHRANISTLSKPFNALIECLPSVASVESENDKASRAEVARLVSKVRDMQIQRQSFESQLRQNLHDDDVTQRLVTNQDDIEEFFKEQLDKHKNLVALLEQNMSAQVNILQAMSEANAAYASTRRMINQVKCQRSDIISSLLSSYNAFLSITNKAEEAQKFYAKLESQISKLNSRVKASCKVQDEEREGKLMANVRQMGDSSSITGYNKIGHNSVRESVSSGPKLKDFLQAGSGLRGGLPAMSVGGTPVDLNKMRADYGQNIVAGIRGATPVPPVYEGSPINSSGMSSANVTPGTLPNQSSSYLPQSLYLPSAPSPAPSYPNQMNYYQPSSVSTISNAVTASQPNSNLVYSSTSVTAPNASSNVPSLTVSSNSTVQFNTVGNYSAQGVPAYQPPYIHGYGDQTRPLNTQNIQYPPQGSAYNPQHLGQPNTGHQYKGTPVSNTYPTTVPSQGQYAIPSQVEGYRPNTSNNTPLTYRNNFQPTQPADGQAKPSLTMNNTFHPQSQFTGQPISISHQPHSIPPNYNNQTVSNPALNVSNVYPQNYNVNSQSQPVSVYANVYKNNPQGHVSFPNSSQYPNQSINHSANSSMTNHSHNQAYPQGHFPNASQKMPMPPSTSVNPMMIMNGGQHPRPTVSSSIPYKVDHGTATPGYNYNQYGQQIPPNMVQPNSHQQITNQNPPNNFPGMPNTYIPNSSQPQNIPYSHSNVTPNTNIQQPKTSQGDISNLDLLSGIDVTVPTTNQWSPLTPQSAQGSVNDDASVSSTTSQPPDVTSTGIPSSKDEPDSKSTEKTATCADHSNGNEHLTNTTSAVLDLAKLAMSKRPASVIDPLSNDEKLDALVLETERFSKFVQGLQKTSLSGLSNLELKWNEFTDQLESKCSSLKVSVGRCYPLKNRFPDNLSFDYTRVVLPSPRDDYINASFVQLKSLEDSIALIITQAPMPNTFNDFWTMVWENQAEIIVSLNSDAEVKSQTCIPGNVSDTFDSGCFSITLKQTRPSVNNEWVQRTFQLTQNTSKSTKVVIHIQFLTWPPSAMPESANSFLQFISEFHNLQKQQRNKLKPVVVHCVSGTGRSGVFAVLSSFIKYVQNYGIIADIWNLLVELSQQRRAAIQDRSHMMFLYSAALYYVQDILMKRGILTDKATFGEVPREKTHVRHPSADLLSSDLNRMKAKLGLGEDPNLSRSESQSSIVSVGSSASSQPNSTHTSSISPSPTHSAKGVTLGNVELPPNLAASLDPSCLSLPPTNPKRPNKITKESFLSPGNLGHSDNGVGGSDDPLSGLDPMWSLKK